MDEMKPLVVLIILDSVRADILYNLIRTNELPYLKKYIVDHAAVVEKCFTSFPTNTMPGHISVISGTIVRQAAQERPGGLVRVRLDLVHGRAPREREAGSARYLLPAR